MKKADFLMALFFVLLHKGKTVMMTEKTTTCEIAYLWIKTNNLLVAFWSKCYIIKQLLTIEALDMM